MDIWVKIEGFNDYEINQEGKVRSLKFNRIKELKSRISKKGYLQVTLSDKKIKTFYIDQLVAFCFLNHNPSGNKIVVDHIDNNKLNNNVNNLQLITNRENSSKDRKNKTSKYTGVSFCKKTNKWVSQIQIKGKIKKIGYFKTEIEASEKYKLTLKSLSVF